ncbi:hypothetical protein BDW74DRAFT_173160 [Aspergillus multicolor]|uniref:uncharacterized protein n=1 Tax=Aspergillus multicolor TaxID=41759 RepID=UPI003CCDB365
MRFLCLHGIGSNSRILQQQTAAIRYELGSGHTYDFVEGTIPWDADPKLKGTMLDGEKTFTYLDPTSAESCLRATELLEQYVAAEGPYDGVIGFSLGSILALSWMIQRQQEKETAPFKVAIFFSSIFPLRDMDALRQGRVVTLESIPEECLDLPTAHIWGANDEGQEHAQNTHRACKAETRSVYVHGKGHEISTAPDDLISMVKVINRAIQQATFWYLTPAEGQLKMGAQDHHHMTDPVQSDTAPEFLHGLQLWVVGVGLCLGLFLPSLEVSIVSTSLITITDDFRGFDQSTWVITSYLLTYTGFLMIWSKCGDIFGVKPSLLCSLIVFVAFSGGCGGAQSMNQLIICRAFQGVGASGVYTLTLFSLLRLVPQKKYDLIATVAAANMALGLVLGPLIGGAINMSGDWRWIFLLNLPAGAVSWTLLLVAMPSSYPYLNSPSQAETSAVQSRLSSIKEAVLAKQKVFFRQVDFLGAFLVLAFSMFIIAALQEGNLNYAWSSALIVSFIVVSGVLLLAFLAWEWLVSRRAKWKIQPMLPWRLTRNRVFLGVALGFLLTGAPLTICVIELPQRYQTVNESSPLGAGVKLLAYALSQPVGSFICSSLSGRLKVPFVYIIMGGVVLQIVGLFLLSSTPTTIDVWTGQFGYAVLAGLGVGLAVTAVYIMVPLVVDEGDQSIALGTGLQLRMLGGALGVAVATAILNDHLQSALRHVISGEQLSAVLESPRAIGLLRPEVQVQVRRIFGEAYNLQMKAAGGFSAGQVLAVLLIWRKEQVRFVRDAR